MPLTRVYQVDRNKKILNAHLSRDNIEDTLISFNTNHYKKAHSTPTYTNYVHNKLLQDDFRDKVLQGNINPNQINDIHLYDLLNLLSNSDWSPKEFEELTIL